MPTAASPAADAAERLYGLHRERVFAYCLACLRAREEAEDAVQTTFLYALRALERGTVPEAELPWLVAIARNVCLARRRNGRRRSEREVLRDPVALEDAVAAPGGGAALEGLDEALAELPESQRRAILLREWRGLSYREIADELGVSGACVETLIFRARRSLADRLEPGRRAGRRVLGGFPFGPLAGLKPFLAGSAAKLALGAAAVAVVVTVAADVPRGDAPRTTADRPAAARQAPGAVAAVPAEEAREHDDLAARTRSGGAEHKERKGAAKGRSEGAGGTPAETSEGSGEGLAVGAGETIVGTVAGTVTGAVDGTVGIVEDATGIDLSALPETPTVIVPELPVELPPTPKLELPPLPVP